MNRARRSPVTVRRDVKSDRNDREERTVRESLDARSKNDKSDNERQIRPQSAKVVNTTKPLSKKVVIDDENDDFEDEDLSSLSSKNTKKIKPSPLSKTNKSKNVEQDDEDNYEEVRKDDHDDIRGNENDEEDDKVEEVSVRGKRQSALLPKAVIAKLIVESGIEGVSSDVYPYVIQEIQGFLKHVIKSLEEEADGDELVIKDSYLRFLGDKSRATGVFDMKSFERVYSATSHDMNVNPEFSSSAFQSLCKYTEIHVIDFLKKAHKIVQFYGRKRLTAKDLDLLKEMLE